MTLPRPTSVRSGLCVNQRNGRGIQEWPDGSKYEGEFVNGLKQGAGVFTWPNGEFYEGSFYKDYRHGCGTYSWPDGGQFTGKFYLNRKEGYGLQRFHDGTTFQGLHHADERFGPGVTTYLDGRQDVGLWYRHWLLRLPTCVGEGFTLRDFPEYMALVPKQQLQTQVFAQASPTQSRRVNSMAPPWDCGPPLQQDEWFVLPPGIESYSTDSDHLPTPQSRRQELDLLFFGRGDIHMPSFSDDPPLQQQMEAHIHTHRFEAEGLDWDVAAVLAMNREGFGPKGPVERTSEKLLRAASLGLYQNVYDILFDGKVHPDVADARGCTALLAATVSCHDDVIHLLLDSGADVNMVNEEGMSALAASCVLYYPFHSLHETVAEKVSQRDALKPEIKASSTMENSPQQKAAGPLTESPGNDSDRKLFLTDSLFVTEQVERVPSGESVGCAEDVPGHAEERKRPSEREKAPWAGNGEAAELELLEEVRSIQLLNIHGNIHVGVQAKGEEEDYRRSVEDHVDLEAEETDWRNGGRAAPETIYDSPRSVVSSVVNSVVSSVVTEDLMQQMAEVPCHKDKDSTTEPQETVHKMPVMLPLHRCQWTTMQLLLTRGADPNASSVPMPVIFLAIKAGHTEGVQRLLESGARTDMPLPTQRKGLYPLHVAAGLPGPKGPKITELLLLAAADPDVKAQDAGEVCELDESMADVQDGSSLGSASPACFSTVILTTPEDGGRTPLHVACQRESDYMNARDVVSILLTHKASTIHLWSGHSPLSLAIASGNDLAVDELLAARADPNLPLSRHIGSALCAAATLSYDRGHLAQSRIKLVEKLIKAGANILMPVVVGEGRRCAIGTALDYAHYFFNQDWRIARAPYHALNQFQRQTYNARRQLLGMMGDLLRLAAVGMETQRLKAEQSQGIHRATPPGNQVGVTDTSSPTESHLRSGTESETGTMIVRKPPFKYCYQCGRSIWVVLTPCSRCHEVFYCSKTCKMKSWSERHREECLRVPGTGQTRYSSGIRLQPFSEKSSQKGRDFQVKTDREYSSTPATHSHRHDPEENYSFI
ncbi:ankyrin repeat and MYND domain-containing protein 1 isoform X3 [Electrophorus electricus]|uniref:ankyrin repeat and MYND domain-containing protein 1 isoform X3 n=1 Tax=Electrophorus electricus TaxID=8005 RepID=UPI0015CFBC3E|nr:ankyrin repeat and MYND domain-containing protein 1 isoform X3 [Electrophorus electricus]